MGMRVVADYTVPPPRPCTITVTCDADHGPLDQPKATFDCTDCHPRDPAVRSGWKFTPAGLVFCPEHAR
jgi:hypothetical protein